MVHHGGLSHGSPQVALSPHLSHEEIARRYRACRDGVEKTHWQALWLLTRPDEPPTPAEVAVAIGLSDGWVRALIRRWNAEGPDGLADRLKAVNGGQSALTTEKPLELWAAL
ncbi:helix-turn-helix domain-containing protein [Tautonia marina]|uniref:helix-turn-helix domain-containing protein n=1 Tax=Tautonia marina TaxID=2653855 RepID=UPI001260C300|nr:helix-turn-helix domain-containing protein [Tautonia marina]